MRMVRFLCALYSKKSQDFSPYIRRWFGCAAMRFHLKEMFTLLVICLEQRKWEASVPLSWKIILKGALFPKWFSSFKVTYNDFIMAQWLWPISSWKERVTRSRRNRNEKAFEAQNQKNISKLPQREKWLSAFCLQPRFSALLPQSTGVAGRVGFHFTTLGNVFGSDLSSKKPTFILWAKHVAVLKRVPMGAPFDATISFSQRCSDGDRGWPCRPQCLSETQGQLRVFLLLHIVMASTQRLCSPGCCLSSFSVVSS